MIEKRIRYQDGKGVHDPLEAIIFLMSKRSSPGGLSSTEEQELQRLMDETGFMSQKKSQGGIMRVAATRGNREYLTTMLARYYSPRDLYYKTTDELSDMLNMHLTETGGLI